MTARGICLQLAVFGALLGLISGQSTTAIPVGQCASYLNRYTKQDQCVYSFIVPKKARDACPGLEGRIASLESTIHELMRRQNATEEKIYNINKNNENLIKIGRLETEIVTLRSEKDKYKEDYDDLMRANAIYNKEKSKQKLELKNAKVALADTRARLEPLERNHSALLNDFVTIRNKLTNIQQQHASLKEEYKQIQELKNCSDVNKHLPSCAVIKQWGYTKSGDAMIDPDGEGGVDPFLVYCDMDTDKSTGITVINHKHQDDTDVSGCDLPGCYNKKIDYRGVSVKQIAKLIDISIACEQEIQYKCYDSKLLKDGTGWWESRNGTKMTYWGGAEPGSNMCQCGMTKTCVDRNEVCNCDSDAEKWLSDEGFLTDKNALPVTSLWFGDVNTESNERGKFTLGPLKCKWNTNSSVPSCGALQRAGVTKSGVYLVDPDGEKGPKAAVPTRCNFVAGTNSTGVATAPKNPNLYEFTDCGKTKGRTGPSEAMCNTTYYGGNVFVRLVEGMQSWRVPRDGRYRIVASAPSGLHPNSAMAGRGAVATAEFNLDDGTQMRILVGQKGLKTAGSGGTFVIKMVKTYTEVPYVIAGAGGSSTANSAKFTVTDASTTANGKDGFISSDNVGEGGTAGHGGGRGNKVSGQNTPGGGAGFLASGTASSDARFSEPLAARHIKGTGSGKNAPGLGGHYLYRNELYDGGFGGGGSGSKNEPGGAGGYSGGGGGSTEGHSGGGGSFTHADALSSNIEAANTNGGRVTIEYLGPKTA